MRFTDYPGIKLEPALGTRQNWIFVYTTAKKVISRHRKNENVFKMSKDEKCTCKACKNIVFQCQICKFVGFLLPSSSWLLRVPCLAPREELLVFANQIWKPQFLSVVQFPLDICHSPFSLTTFFEIGVFKWNGLAFHWCFSNKHNITWLLGDFSLLALKNISLVRWVHS